MCWFVTIGTRSTSEQLACRSDGLTFTASKNPHVAKLFAPNDVRFEVTHGGCSCDLYSPPSSGSDAFVERVLAADRYRAKGWGEAKIARALRASDDAKLSSIGKSKETGCERAFRELIAEPIRESGSIRVFAHMYSSSVLNEVVECKARRRIGLAEFLASGFAPDELVEVVADML